jgi:hypothetical protein
MGGGSRWRRRRARNIARGCQIMRFEIFCSAGRGRGGTRRGAQDTAPAPSAHSTWAGDMLSTRMARSNWSGGIATPTQLAKATATQQGAVPGRGSAAARRRRPQRRMWGSAAARRRGAARTHKAHGRDSGGEFPSRPRLESLHAPAAARRRQAAARQAAARQAAAAACCCSSSTRCGPALAGRGLSDSIPRWRARRRPNQQGCGHPHAVSVHGAPACHAAPGRGRRGPRPALQRAPEGALCPMRARARGTPSSVGDDRARERRFPARAAACEGGGHPRGGQVLFGAGEPRNQPRDV